MFDSALTWLTCRLETVSLLARQSLGDSNLSEGQGGICLLAAVVGILVVGIARLFLYRR